MTTAKEAALNVWKAFGARNAAAIRAAFTPDGRWVAPPGNATAIAAGVERSARPTHQFQ